MRHRITHIQKPNLCLLTALIILFAAFVPDISAQQPLQVLLEDNPRIRVSSLISAVSSNEYCYIAGESTAECYYGGYIACMDKDGNEIWNSIKTEDRELVGRASLLKVIDNELYAVVSEAQAVKPWEVPLFQFYALKLNPLTGAIVWRVPLPLEVTSSLTLNNAELSDILEFRDDKIAILSGATNGGAAKYGSTFLIDKADGTVLRKIDHELVTNRPLKSILINAAGEMFFVNDRMLAKVSDPLADQLVVDWDVEIGNIPDSHRFLESFLGENNQLYVPVEDSSRNYGRIQIFNTVSGAILQPILLDTPPRMPVDILSVDWPHIFYNSALPSESDPTVDATHLVKHNLAENRIVWTQEVWDLLGTPRKVTETTQGDVGVLTYNYDRKTLGYSLYYGESGTPIIQAILDDKIDEESSLRGLSFLTNVADSQRLVISQLYFNKYVDEEFEYQHTQMYSLGRYHADIKPVGRIEGVTRFPSYVHSTLSVENGNSLQLRQVGTETVLAFLDEDNNVVWTRTPRSDHDYFAARGIAVNQDGLIAIASEYFRLFETRNRPAAFGWPGLKPGNVWTTAILVDIYDVSGQLQRTLTFNGESHKPVRFDGLAASGSDFVALIELDDSFRQSDNRTQIHIFNQTDLVSLDTYPKFQSWSDNRNIALLSGAGGNYLIGRTNAFGTPPGLKKINATGWESSDFLKVWPRYDFVWEVGTFENTALLKATVKEPDNGKDNQIELFAIDLDTGQIQWQVEVPFTEHLIKAKRDQQGRIYTFGYQYNNADSTDASLVVTKLGPANNTIEWTATSDWNGMQSFADLDFTFNDGELLAVGTITADPGAGNPLSFVLRYDANGNELFRSLRPNSRTRSISSQSPGRHLVHLEEQLDGDCFVSGTSYLIETDRFTHLAEKPAAAESSVNIYPNPADNELFVEFSAADKLAYTIVVRDVLGREVYQTANRAVGAEQGLRINVSGLNRGVYSLEVIHPAAKSRVHTQMFVLE